MEKQTLIAHCLTYPNAVEDYPFADNDLTIMRHPSGGKWFACIMHLQGKLCINLKCDPVRSEFLRRTYKGVYPAWHMNKEHWNTVEVNSVPKGELFAMIAHSFELTAPNVNKGSALVRLKRLLDPMPRQVVAIGDYLNDLEMLAEADIAAAPSSALPEVKARARIITQDHTQSAIADLVQQLAAYV